MLDSICTKRLFFNGALSINQKACSKVCPKTEIYAMLVTIGSKGIFSQYPHKNSHLDLFVLL